MKQAGYTLMELVVGLGVILSLLLAGGLLYIGFHFIAKIW